MQQLPIDQHPAWYGAVMGTGVIALVVFGLGDAFGVTGDWPTWTAAVFVLPASALAVLLAPRYLRRVVPTGREQLHRELREPASGALLGTAPGGLLVLAVAWPRVLGESGDAAYVVGGALLVLGAALAVVGVAWALAIADNDRPRLTHVNGAWLGPPVVNVLVALAIAPYLQRVPESWVSSSRRDCCSGAPASCCSSWCCRSWWHGWPWSRWPLRWLRPPTSSRSRRPGSPGPPWSVSSAPGRGGAFPAGTVPSAAVLAGALLGFGAWYTLLALLFLQRYRRMGAIPFHPGWWGFTFPLGAMAVSLALQAELWDASALAWPALAYAAALAWA